MTLTIGALRAEAGRKTRGSLPADLGTTTVDVSLILVNGSREIRAMAHAVGYERVTLGAGPDGGNGHAAAHGRGNPALLDGPCRLPHHLGVDGIRRLREEGGPPWMPSTRRSSRS
ncbi:hypothetical protein [Streptomyces sp. SID5643]|uniref:hypothetical protein n=1 Tax=Streptomyces sp. SID5643 TaxID=2690307 RepID=UPI0013705DD9|nr:hypothetical protein [Streptomyces sp. SID5643]MZF84801.1 hypothetical protein [Streptomyces sp. SID5643]